MKKIMLFAFALLLLVGIATAIGEGDVISQAQLDSIDADTVDLQCNYNGYDYGFVRVNFNFDCLSIKDNEDETYIVIVQPIGIYYSYFEGIRKMTQCMSEGYTLSQCKTWFKADVLKPFVLFHFNQEKLEIRELISDYQTTPTLDEDDFSILIEAGDL